jgi:hypothetical protein
MSDDRDATQPPVVPGATRTPYQKTLDTKTVEVLALAVFRGLFREGLHIPLKRPGMMDMDLVVKDNNVLLNVNQVQTDVPELAIWRITFAYRGKPVIEYGRGIKNDMRIHYPQLCFLLVAIWREKRRKNRARAGGDQARDREMITMSLSGPNLESAGEAAS